MNKRILIVLLIAAFLPGCKKYDEGPLLSLYSKETRVAGTWYFQNVWYGGKDSTEHYRYQYLDFLSVKKSNGGAFSWNHNLMATSADEYPIEGGTWRFLADKDSIEMVVYKNTLTDSVVLQWKINRLAYTEFWIERNIKDTILLKWNLVKYVY
jgi:hypothetical protein